MAEMAAEWREKIPLKTMAVAALAFSVANGSDGFPTHAVDDVNLQPDGIVRFYRQFSGYNRT